MTPIRIGDEFQLTREGWVNTFRREPDAVDPQFECERVQITHLACTGEPRGFKPYTFGAEPEWFRRRGLIAI